ncbi:hypothetical protein [Flavobacterium sp.]|uniref:hypothetical protein n=1 Tax=Flavobacterium sp. TaxID=239 RepID=UPI00286BC2D6|nr:hypothetical protein [Flavobacterium sp.]
MKRIASLFLVVVLFYNMLGYYLIFAQKKEQEWVASNQKNNVSTYKVLKLNASLYTFTEDTDFEYVNENVEINNKIYHIFKKRIQNNILSLYYLQNAHQDKVDKQLIEIVDSQLFDTSSTKEMPVKKLLKSFIKDYVVHEVTTVPIPSKNYIHKVAFTTTITPIREGYCSLSYSPPDFV